MDLASTGSAITKKQILNAMVTVTLESLEVTLKEETNPSEEVVQFTFDDFKM